MFILVYSVLQTYYLQSRCGAITSYHNTKICYNVSSIRTHFTCLDMSTDVFNNFCRFNNIWYHNVTPRLSVRAVTTSYSDYAIHMCHVGGTPSPSRPIALYGAEFYRRMTQQRGGVCRGGGGDAGAPVRKQVQGNSCRLQG